MKDFGRGVWLDHICAEAYSDDADKWNLMYLTLDEAKICHAALMDQRAAREQERIAQEHSQMSVLLERVIDAVESDNGLGKGSGLMIAIHTVVNKIKNTPIILESDNAEEAAQ